MTCQERLIDRWRARVDPLYRAQEPYVRGLLRRTLIGDRLALVVAMGQMWHAIRGVLRPIVQWAATQIDASR